MNPSLPARLLILLSVVAIANSFLTACETTIKAKDFVFPPEVTVTLIGSPTQNPDDKGLPLSVVVRLYSLRSKDRVEKANMRTLQRSDQEALGGDIIDRKEKTLRPGANEEIIISLKEKDKPKGTRAEYLAVIAFLRKPEGESWRWIIPGKDIKSKKLEIIVLERGMKITPAD